MQPVSVSSFLDKPSGARMDLEIDELWDLEWVEPVIFLSHVKAKIEMMKLPHEINVHLVNAAARVELTCARCLSPFTYEVKVPSAQREFIYDLEARDIGEDEDVFYVDKKSHSIDLEPMISEELLLHFPVVSVCSEGCKGLCERCGVNRNKETCVCPPQDQVHHNPLHNLSL